MQTQEGEQATRGDYLLQAKRFRIERLRILAAQGLPTWVLAERLGMTEDEVRTLAKNHGIKLSLASW